MGNSVLLTQFELRKQMIPRQILNATYKVNAILGP